MNLHCGGFRAFSAASITRSERWALEAPQVVDSGLAPESSRLRAPAIRPGRTYHPQTDRHAPVP